MIRLRRCRAHRLAALARSASFAALLPAILLSAPRASGQPAPVTERGPLRAAPEALTRQAPDEALASLRRAARPAAATHVVVRFDAPLTAAERRAMRDGGLELTQPLGANAWYAAVRAGGVDVAALPANALVAVSSIQPEWKLHPLLAQRRVPDWARPAVAAPFDSADRVYVAVSFHRDAGLGVEARHVIERHGGDIRSRLHAAHAVLAEIDEDALDALASEDIVAWIELPLPRLTNTLDQVRSRTGADLMPAPPYELDGSGVSVMVFDGGLGLSDHSDFEGRLFKRDFFLEVDHATHVAGIIGGAGVASGGQYSGVAPAVTLESYTVEPVGSGTPLFQDPGDLENDYDQGVNTFGAAIVNNSIGSNAAKNGFPCEITGDYGVTAALIDGLVAGALGEPLRVIFANGNERSSPNCGQGYATTAPPAGAKNHITVGALNSNDDSVTFFTSWGPVDDGRMKPDVSAPGCQVGGDGGVTSAGAGSTSEYVTFCGTSMAAPAVTGAGALLLQDYRARYPGRPDFRNSTLKVLLAHTAADVANAGPDYQSGFGSVRIPAAVDLLRSGAFLETSVDQGGVAVFHVQVPPGAAELKATIAWDDPPAAPGAAAALVNDLDVRLIDPGGGVHHPWTLDPNDPASPAARTGPDRLNNIEQALVESPQAGLWRIEVAGWSVPQGPQVFSLAASPGLISTQVEFPAGSPPLVAPGTGRELEVRFVTRNDSIVPGSATLHLSRNGAPAQPLALTHDGADVWTASLPPITCGDDVTFFIEAETQAAGALTFPPAGAASSYSLEIGQTIEVFRDEFETAQGWIVGAPGDTASTGVWTRVDPVGTADADGRPSQPENDHTPSGTHCFVTGQGLIGGAIGAEDVDGGATRLISPAIDLSEVSNPRIEFWRWYANDKGAAPNADEFQVDISNDDGASWTNVEVLGPAGLGTSGGWRRMVFSVADYVAPSSAVRLRFIASDFFEGSIVEAAIDDVVVTGEACAPSCPGDFNADGVVDGADLGLLLSAWGGEAGDPADLNADGLVDGADLGVLLAAWGACG